MELTEEQKTSRKKLLGLGCVVVLAFIAFTAWFSWEAIQQSKGFREISETVESAARSVRDASAVAREVRAVYPADELNLKFRIKTDAKTQTSTRILDVEIVNPEFEIPDGGAGVLAEEIAHKVASIFPGVEQYDQVEVNFIQQSGMGIKFQTTVNFPFSTSELLQ